ncbi:MAG TPA: hypothetical protein VI451_19575, partial [Anaerolineales bacterium]|nr:hypothetical protein [Anaerolineales bacterium]
MMPIQNITSKSKRLIIFFIWIGIPSLFVFAAPSLAGKGESVVPLDRELEPVIVKGVFLGTPVDDIFVYRENSGSWEQVPFQIDEVTDSGAYTTTENLVMDANDEVVFMIKDLGDSATTSITETLPIDPFWYQIEVTDPLNPSAKGWAYIVRSSDLNQTNNTDYVNFNTGSQRIIAENYTLGWSTDFGGLNYLSLFGSNNIIDRSKIRVNIGSFIWTEEDFPAPENVLVKDGRV